MWFWRPSQAAHPWCGFPAAILTWYSKIKSQSHIFPLRYLSLSPVKEIMMFLSWTNVLMVSLPCKRVSSYKKTRPIRFAYAHEIRSCGGRSEGKCTEKFIYWINTNVFLHKTIFLHLISSILLLEVHKHKSCDFLSSHANLFTWIVVQFMGFSQFS